MSNQRPTRRYDSRPKTATAWFYLVVFILCFVFALLVFYAVNKNIEKKYTVQTTHRPTMDSMAFTYTSDGDVIKVYVVTDPDYGRQYLVTDHGGITPRLKDQANVVE